MDAQSPKFSNVIFGGSQYQDTEQASFDVVIDIDKIEKDFNGHSVRRLVRNELTSSPIPQPRRGNDVVSYGAGHSIKKRSPAQVWHDVQSNIRQPLANRTQPLEALAYFPTIDLDQSDSTTPRNENAVEYSKWDMEKKIKFVLIIMFLILYMGYCIYKQFFAAN